MAKLWKFLAIPIVVAVCLGLLLVPGLVSGYTSPACWLEIDPASTGVGFDENFSVNVTFQNPNATEINTIMSHINYTPSLVEVISVDYGAAVGSPFTIDLAAPTWDNTEGWLDYDGGILGDTTDVTSCVFATIHMKSKGLTGIADIEFVPVDSWGDPETVILDTLASDHTDWSAVVNGTLEVRLPTLTVNVSPNGTGDVKINGTIPSGYPNTTSWDSDAVVPLEAVNSVPNWTFTEWSGDLTGSDNTTSIIMDWDKSVTAHFVTTGTTATLEGNVTFLGRGAAPGSKWMEPFTVKGFEAGNLSNVLWTANATTDNTGGFIIAGLTPGTYDIGIKNWTCLSILDTSVVLSGGNTTVVDFGTTREGDANDNDWVTMADLSLLLPAWNTDTGDPEYDVNYDFNRDGYVTMADLSLMLPNWNQHGDLV